jgi:hypothetical protein
MTPTSAGSVLASQYAHWRRKANWVPSPNAITARNANALHRIRVGGAGCPPHGAVPRRLLTVPKESLSVRDLSEFWARREEQLVVNASLLE